MGIHACINRVRGDFSVWNFAEKSPPTHPPTSVSEWWPWTVAGTFVFAQHHDFTVKLTFRIKKASLQHVAVLVGPVLTSCHKWHVNGWATANDITVTMTSNTKIVISWVRQPAHITPGGGGYTTPVSYRKSVSMVYCGRCRLLRFFCLHHWADCQNIFFHVCCMSTLHNTLLSLLSSLDTPHLAERCILFLDDLCLKF